MRECRPQNDPEFRVALCTEISKFLLTSFWFRSDLSLFGSGVFAASRMQLTKMVNKMKYSKGLSSVKEYMIRTQTHKYVKLENKISQEHATETVQIDQEKIHHDFTTLHTNKGPQHARSTAAVDDNKLTDNAKPERTFCTKTFRSHQRILYSRRSCGIFF